MNRRAVLSALATLPWLPYAIANEQTSRGHHGNNHGKRVGLAMSAAFAPDGALCILGLDEHRRLFIQESRDEGAHWSKPRIIDTNGDTIAAEGELRPKLAFGPDGWAVIAYTQPLSKPYTGEIRMMRSTDGARTFSRPYTVHEDRQIITHRFESIAFDATGALHTVWVDKRDLHWAKLKDKDAQYVGAAIYRNVSRDGGYSFSLDTKIVDHSCECCRIALAPSADGGIAVLWRHVFDGNVRDHAFATISPGGETASPVQRATFDEWSIEACPHHGPSLTPASDGGYHAVWFGIRKDEPAVRYARLDSRGRPRGPVRVLPDEGAEHADVQSVGSNVAIVWRSFDGKRTRYSAWLSKDDGKSFVLRELGSTSLENDHPFIVRRGRSLYAIWRTREAVHVERLYA